MVRILPLSRAGRWSGTLFPTVVATASSMTRLVPRQRRRPGIGPRGAVLQSHIPRLTSGAVAARAYMYGRSVTSGQRHWVLGSPVVRYPDPRRTRVADTEPLVGVGQQPVLDHPIATESGLHVREDPVEVRLTRGGLAVDHRSRPDLDRDAVAGRVLADLGRRPAERLDSGVWPRLRLAREHHTAGQHRRQHRIGVTDRDLHRHALQRVGSLEGDTDGAVCVLLGDLVALFVLGRERDPDETLRRVRLLGIRPPSSSARHPDGHTLH